MEGQHNHIKKTYIMFELKKNVLINTNEKRRWCVMRNISHRRFSIESIDGVLDWANDPINENILLSFVELGPTGRQTKVASPCPTVEEADIL
jgi:hypothetical protein